MPEGLSDAFLNDLELSLRKALQVVEGRWCDGLLPPEWESDYMPSYVARSRQLMLRAWLDEGRRKGQASTQALYRLVLHLGPDSLAIYLRTHTLPGTLIRRIQPEHLTLDASSKTLVVQLP